MGTGAGQRPTEYDFGQFTKGSFGRPAGRIIASGTQALADNTVVAITFTGADELDTDGFHNPSSNPTRVTPNVAGWYRVTGSVWFAALTTPVRTAAYLRKNGGAASAPSSEDAASTRVHNRSITQLMSFNGTTDYVELLGLQDSAGANNTNQSGGSSCCLEWEFVRNL